MRLAFAGTPEFAARILEHILDAGHQVCMVFTQPDRSSGRGMNMTVGAVKRVALDHRLALAQPVTLKDDSAGEGLRAANVDLLVVAAYGLILPPRILEIPRLGAVNVHASLLPRWRGAAPIQRALLAGDRHTGICIMQMDAGLDTGPVLRREAIEIGDQDDAGSLHDRLAALGAHLALRTLDDLAAGRAVATAQSAQGVTYAPKIKKSETAIDWGCAAEQIWRQVRAFSPRPGAVTRSGAMELKLWRAEAHERSGPPGTVLEASSQGILVACGTGSLRILELQRTGGRRLSSSNFLNGVTIRAGDRLGGE